MYMLTLVITLTVAAAIVYLLWLRPRVLSIRYGLLEEWRRGALDKAFPALDNYEVQHLRGGADQLAAAEKDALAIEKKVRSCAFATPAFPAPQESAGAVFGCLTDCVKKGSPVMMVIELALNVKSAFGKYKSHKEQLFGRWDPEGQTYEVVVDGNDAITQQILQPKSVTEPVLCDLNKVEGEFHSEVSESGTLLNLARSAEGYDGCKDAGSMLVGAGNLFFDGAQNGQVFSPAVEPLTLPISEHMDQVVHSILGGTDSVSGALIDGMADASSAVTDGSFHFPVVTAMFSLQREGAKLLKKKVSFWRAAKHILLDITGSGTGAAVGATLGSVFPGPGTVIGGVVGAIIGRLSTNGIKALPFRHAAAEYDRLRYEADAAAKQSSDQALQRVSGTILEEQKKYRQIIGECPRLSSTQKRQALTDVAEDLCSLIEKAANQTQDELSAAIEKVYDNKLDRWYHRLLGVTVDDKPSIVIEHLRTNITRSLSDIRNKISSRESLERQPLQVIIELSGHTAQKYMRGMNRLERLTEALRRTYDLYVLEVYRWKLSAADHYVNGYSVVRQIYDAEVTRHNALYDSYKLRAEETGRKLLKEMEALGKA